MNINNITYFIKYSIFRCLRLKFKHPRNSDEIITKLFKPTKPCHKNYPRIFSLLYPLAIKCGKCVYIDLDDSFLFSHKYSTLLETKGTKEANKLLVYSNLTLHMSYRDGK